MSEANGEESALPALQARAQASAAARQAWRERQDRLAREAKLPPPRSQSELDYALMRVCSGAKLAGVGADTVAGLLAAGANPKAKDEEGATPLARCARRLDLENLLALLPVSDPDEADKNGDTALMHACRLGFLSGVRALLPVSDARIGNILGVTPLMQLAGSERQLEMVVELLRLLLPRSDPNARDNAGNTALHHACEKRRLYASKRAPEQQQLAAQQLSLVRLLASACDPEALNDKGCSALYRAIEMGPDAEEEARELLSRCDPGATHPRSGETLLMVAMRHGSEGLIMELLRLCDPWARDEQGLTAWDHGMRAERGELVSRLQADRERLELGRVSQAGSFARELSLRI